MRLGCSNFPQDIVRRSERSNDFEVAEEFFTAISNGIIQDLISPL
jgi:hypothetical protein